MTFPPPRILDGSGSELLQLAGSDPELKALEDAERKQHAFTRHWTQHQYALRAYLTSFLGNRPEVDDALQDLALIVWQKGPVERDSSDFLRYSLACARRIALAACRKQGNLRMELLSPEAAAMVADQVLLLEQQEIGTPDKLTRSLRECMEMIKPEHRELLESRYSRESKEELDMISKRVGKSMDSIYKTLERLRERLRACVERRQNSQG